MQTTTKSRAPTQTAEAPNLDNGNSRPLKIDASKIVTPWQKMEVTIQGERLLQNKYFQKPKGSKKVEEDFEKRCHMIGDKIYGINAAAIKESTVCAAKDAGVDMKTARRLFLVIEPFPEIKCEKAEARFDMAKIRGAYVEVMRAQFTNWSIDFTFEFNSERLDPVELIRWVMMAGKSVGIGSWSPLCKGSYGTFTVV